MTDNETGNPIFLGDLATYENVQQTGCYAADCVSGRNLAEAVIRQMLATEFTPLLGHVVDHHFNGGPRTGIQVGFFQRIAERCITAA